MIFYKRILGFILALIFGLIFEFVYYNPRFFLFGFLLSILLIFFYFWRIKNRFIKNTEIFSYLFITLTFLFCLWAFFVVADNLIIRTIVLVFCVYFFMVLFDSFFKKIYENKEISNEIIKSMDFICFLFFSFFTFYVFTFIRANLIISSVFILLISFICLIIKLYWEKIEWKKYKFSLIIVSIIFTEIYIGMSLLPFNIYFLTFITWLWYYLVSEFFIDDIKGQVLFKNKINLFVIFISVLVVSFITAIIKY
ncbi:MAG TPA: hypothetical protein PKL13_04085 [bacterium]|nr:hypothetical protein [bacterium]